jgi:hypothetical protein
VVDEDGRLIAGINTYPHHYPEMAGFVYGLRYVVHKAIIDRAIRRFNAGLSRIKSGKQVWRADIP